MLAIYAEEDISQGMHFKPEDNASADELPSNVQPKRNNRPVLTLVDNKKKMIPPKQSLYTINALKRLDLRAQTALGVDAYTLMKRAATQAFKILKAQFTQVKCWAIFCGTGNNAW